VGEGGAESRGEGEAVSRLNDIRTAVAAHVTTAFTAAGETVTLSAIPDVFDALNISEYPHARIIFVEEDPERLAFKQQRRRVVGEIAIGMFGETVTRETVDARIEAIRDLIFADPYLSASVDDITAEAGVTVSNPDENKVFGTLDITTEEVF
jgi:hypothetical protein